MGRPIECIGQIPLAVHGFDMTLSSIIKEIRTYTKKERALANAWYFKTGKGEYGEGDRFLGLTMREQRLIAKKYRVLDFPDIAKLLGSEWHEERMIGLLILVLQYEKARGETEKRKVLDFYVAHRRAVNNWDLVDVTTPNVIGDFLSEKKDRTLLYQFARSNNLWERRMAILGTFRLIRNGNFPDAFAISELLIGDTHDLIHKAVGWMLREIGKKDKKALVSFLKTHASRMPRIMLRSAIERFLPEERMRFLGMKRV
jgi:3-methyladenine DNA glycosylase AlkD